MATSLALAISYPTLAAAPHMFINAYKNALAISVATEYTFPQAEKVKEFLKVSHQIEQLLKRWLLYCLCIDVDFLV